MDLRIKSNVEHAGETVAIPLESNLWADWNEAQNICDL